MVLYYSLLKPIKRCVQTAFMTVWPNFSPARFSSLYHCSSQVLCESVRDILNLSVLSEDTLSVELLVSVRFILYLSFSGTLYLRYISSKSFVSTSLVSEESRSEPLVFAQPLIPCVQLESCLKEHAA